MRSNGARRRGLGRRGEAERVGAGERSGGRGTWWVRWVARSGAQRAGNHEITWNMRCSFWISDLVKL